MRKKTTQWWVVWWCKEETSTRRIMLQRYITKSHKSNVHRRATSDVHRQPTFDVHRRPLNRFQDQNAIKGWRHETIQYSFWFLVWSTLRPNLLDLCESHCFRPVSHPHSAAKQSLSLWQRRLPLLPPDVLQPPHGINRVESWILRQILAKETVNLARACCLHMH